MAVALFAKAEDVDLMTKARGDLALIGSCCRHAAFHDALLEFLARESGDIDDGVRALFAEYAGSTPYAWAVVGWLSAGRRRYREALLHLDHATSWPGLSRADALLFGMLAAWARYLSGTDLSYWHASGPCCMEPLEEARDLFCDIAGEYPDCLLAHLGAARAEIALGLVASARGRLREAQRLLVPGSVYEEEYRLVEAELADGG